jgi:hypothetical protein
MAVDLYSYTACLGTLVIDWEKRTVLFAGMDGDGGDEMTIDQVKATLAEHAGNPDVKAMALIFWTENEQLAVHDVESFEAELAHEREVRSMDDEETEPATEESGQDEAAIRELAAIQYGSSEINIDADAIVSVGNDGAYVEAWVFVSKDDIPGWDPDEEDHEVIEEVPGA